MDRTLFDNALLNYNYAVNGYNTIGDDEMYLNLVGFNLQQALELCMKHLLKENGVRYGRTHDISQLICLADENNINLCVSDYIREHSEMFTASDIPLSVNSILNRSLISFTNADSK